jgi:3-oxoadipate enol-lactonase
VVVTLAHTLDGPGDAPVLVLPSSLGTTRELWEPQLAAFARDFRVLRYEHRGHGESPVPPGPYAMADLAADALALLDELEIERAAWCGLSLGGMVGMWIAARAPERLSGLALACTSARIGAPDAYRERAALVRERGIEPVADAVVARWFSAETFRERPQLAARFRAVLVAQPAEGYAGCCEALAGWDFRDELAAIPVSTVVVAGSEDEATPSADTELLAERIPAARLVTLDGAAHLANRERPEAFAEAVLSHLLEHA